jgi:DNA-binding IclR family transcriptional regulator
MLMLAIRNSADRDKATRCLEVLQEMIKAYENGNITVKPTRWSFHIVLTACLKTTNAREAEESLTDVFRETFHAFTAKREWEPSSSTYHLLMSVCRTLGRSNDTALFDEVQRYCEASGKVELAAQSPLERKQYFWETLRERR